MKWRSMLRARHALGAYAVAEGCSFAAHQYRVREMERAPRCAPPCAFGTREAPLHPGPRPPRPPSPTPRVLFRRRRSPPLPSPPTALDPPPSPLDRRWSMEEGSTSTATSGGSRASSSGPTPASVPGCLQRRPSRPSPATARSACCASTSPRASARSSRGRVPPRGDAQGRGPPRRARVRARPRVQARVEFVGRWRRRRDRARTQDRQSQNLLGRDASGEVGERRLLGFFRGARLPRHGRRRELRRGGERPRTPLCGLHTPESVRHGALLQTRRLPRSDLRVQGARRSVAGSRRVRAPRDGPRTSCSGSARPSPSLLRARGGRAGLSLRGTIGTTPAVSPRHRHRHRAVRGVRRRSPATGRFWRQVAEHIVRP